MCVRAAVRQLAVHVVWLQPDEYRVKRMYFEDVDRVVKSHGRTLKAVYTHYSHIKEVSRREVPAAAACCCCCRCLCPAAPSAFFVCSARSS